MTEREVVLRERAAYARGRIEAPVQWGDLALTKRIAEQLAAETYPMPKAKVTRPRVVRDECVLDKAPVEWRVVDGRIEVRYANIGQEWKVLGAGWTITPDRVRMLADLLATPNETVEDA